MLRGQIPTPAAPRRRAAAAAELRRGIVLALVAGLYFVVVEVVVGWARLLGDAVHAGAVPLLLVALGVVGSYVLRALRIRAALAARARLRLVDVVRVFAVHNAANWLLPARTGEISLPLQLRRHFAVPLAQGTGLLLWLRLQDLHVLTTIGGLALCAGAGGSWSRLGALMVAAGVALPLLGWQLAPRLGARSPRLRRVVEAAPRRARAVLADLALSWAAWTVKLLALGGALAWLLAIPVAGGVLGALGGDVAAVLPVHAPLGAGSYEAGVLLGVAPWRMQAGIDIAAALAAAVQLHALLLLTALAGGAFGITLRIRPVPVAAAADDRPVAVEPAP